jgi:hypothetical protein
VVFSTFKTALSKTNHSGPLFASPSSKVSIGTPDIGAETWGAGLEGAAVVFGEAANPQTKNTTTNKDAPKTKAFLMFFSSLSLLLAFLEKVDINHISAHKICQTIIP